MAHKLKVCDQFRTFTGLPMNLSAGKSFASSVLTIKIFKRGVLRLEKIELVVFGQK